MSSQGKIPLSGRAGAALAGGFIVLAAVAVYYSSIDAPFVFDGPDSIVANPSIRCLWPLWAPLSPPSGGHTVSGRPILNLTLALNYALGGADVRGYHVANVAIHILSGLFLLGILRRTLALPAIAAQFGRGAMFVAAAAATIWTIHPLHTQSVTYVIQRAESLAGLFYLATLYCAIRGFASSPGILWYALSTINCLLGMATKEVVATAPLMVLLYDRVFWTSSVKDSLRRRWPAYLSLAMTWLLLAWLVLGNSSRGSTAGLHARVTWWEYALSQPQVILKYLGLALWPHPLVLDYGWPVASIAWDTIAWTLAAGGLLAAAILALRRFPSAGFLGVAYFLLLAPTSSVLPIDDLMCEHRTYLPLAAVTILAVAGAYWLWVRPVRANRLVHHSAAVVVAVAVALALGLATAARNGDYQSELSIWQDTVRKRPQNARAHHNVGQAYFVLGQTNLAIAQYRMALELKKDFPLAYVNLGNALMRLDLKDQALQCYQQALQIQADFAEGHYVLGNFRMNEGNLMEAMDHYRKAIVAQPEHCEAHNNLGLVLAKLGDTDQALGHYRVALRINPNYRQAHFNMANLLVAGGHASEAIEHYRRAISLDFTYAEAHYNLANILAGRGELSQAMNHYQQAISHKPDMADAHHNLGSVLRLLGRPAEAVEQYERALAIDANHIGAMRNLAWLLATTLPASSENLARSLTLAQRAVLPAPNAIESLDVLAAAHAANGQFSQAVAVAERAVVLARAAGHLQRAAVLESRLGLYRQGKAYREQAASQGGQ
ncbi:MAG: tetratricopeptide repeat protein [Planctomycetaceae bacterium]|nr:tetratricopeptide repeat protein [Planctomycetaceae bacterium]